MLSLLCVKEKCKCDWGIVMFLISEEESENNLSYTVKCFTKLLVLSSKNLYLRKKKKKKNEATPKQKPNQNKNNPEIRNLNLVYQVA